MKTIRSEYVHMRIMKKLYTMIFSSMLIFTLVLTVPGGYHIAYAAPLEDCDLDGFDDATGVPVPWPGYDETKEDTPEGPGGSKTPATAPGSTDSTTAGNSNSETPGKTSDEDSGQTNSVKSENSNDANSSKTNSTKSENTDNAKSGKTNSTVQDNTAKVESGKTSSATSSKTNSAAADNTSKVDSGNTNSTAQDNTSKVEAGKTNNTVQENTGKVESDKASSTAQENTGKVESGKTSSTTSSKTNSGAAENTSSSVSSEENNQDETSQIEKEQAEVNSDNGNTENSYTSADEIESVINTKGSLEITEATGSIIHAGSLVIISGSGFVEDIPNLEIEIQSEPRKLGIVESSENGSFEVQLNIPEDLEAGVHHIVILYQGKEITRQQIEVGPKAADSFLQALSVGFTKDNKGLIPGLLILLGLFVSGVGVLGVNVLFRFRQNKR